MKKTLIKSFAQITKRFFILLLSIILISCMIFPCYAKQTDSSVIVEDGVIRIEDWEYSDAFDLRRITLPDTITYIGDYAFYRCFNLKEINIPLSTRYIGKNAFELCQYLNEIIIPANTAYIGEAICAFCDNLHILEVDPNNTSYYSFHNCIIDKKTQTVIVGLNYDGLVTDEDYPIKEIGKYAFYGCDKRKWMTIPEGVTAINEYAFSGCSSLEKIYIPTSVSYIAENAFSNNKKVNIYGSSGSYVQTWAEENGYNFIPHIHSYEDGAIIDKATCVDYGKQYIDCTECYAQKVKKTEPLGHREGNVEIENEIAATCTSDGSFDQVVYCYLCNQELRRTKNVVPALGHKFDPESEYCLNGCETKNPDYDFDSIPPTCSISCTNNVASNQTATLSMSDNNAISGYYWGTSATYIDNTYTATNATSATQIISAPGTYYLTVKDSVGNLSTTSITLYETILDANGGIVYPTSVLTKLIDSFALPTPTMSGYLFDGWYDSANDGNRITSPLTVTEDSILYAYWTPVPKNTYTVTYDANGGNGAPSKQNKTEGEPLTLTSDKPSKTYTITYDANGGNVSPQSRKVSCVFNSWNTKKDGSGTTYKPGGTYSSDANATLYTQWKNPTAGELETPTRSGYNFDGWYTSASGGTKVTSSSTISANTTVYAHWTPVPKNTYTVTYDANGGNGAPSAQTKTEGKALTLSTSKPSKSYTITYNANEGTVSPSSKSVNCTFNNWNTKKDGSGTSYNPSGSYTKDANLMLYAQWKNPTAGDLATPTRSGYTFDGWYTSASGGTKVTSTLTISANTTVYAHWTAVPKNTYTVKYDANGGTGTPAVQEKTQDIALKLSSAVPTKSFTIYYNANGGSVSPASVPVSCTFTGWNTAKNGGGKNYASGSSYTSDADVTLYAQWENPSAGSLAVPKLSGSTFNGWYTSAKGGTKVTSSTVISANTTVYAHWSQGKENIFDLGEETYGFSNYGDADSSGGHCFGMSVTSSGYYLGLLDIGKIGGDENSKLYSFSLTSVVKAPICHYQAIQGSYSLYAIVAGGSTYLTGKSDIKTDWREVVDYVKNHEYDGKGSLQIGFRKNGEGGHAINFLRFENVNGQDRIYAYDNNFPTQETYFYMSSGKVYQAPIATFSGSIDCISLRDIEKYYSIAGTYDSSRFFYCAKDDMYVRGLKAYDMEGNIDGKEYVMYEVPEEQQRVILIPLTNNADFIYMDTEYSFGEIKDDTYGTFELADMKEGSVSKNPSFKIVNAPINTGEIRGDANGDGEVLANDARLVLRASAKLEKLDDAAFRRCDLDGDGKLLAVEARLILRYSAKLETTI